MASRSESSSRLFPRYPVMRVWPGIRTARRNFYPAAREPSGTRPSKHSGDGKVAVRCLGSKMCLSPSPWTVLGPLTEVEVQIAFLASCGL
jgi:hypothetical protein